ncbi:MAG: NUDIX domain-containing protein [Oscillospiraceae bacterium]|nr:NUDIX domain-containing protein [Oscillospiraceae bacterium]
MKLRNMTTVYVFHNDKILFIKKTGSRIFSSPNTILWCGIGGHFENKELNNPENCVVRELFEETSLKESDMKNLALKYITLRKKEEEIRQQYIYFADLANPCAVLRECDEGELHWVKINDISNLEMAFNNAQCLNHYFQTGKNDDFIYVCAIEVKNSDNMPHAVFTPLQDFDTKY